MTSQISVKIHLEDGSFWATVDEYPGVFATGDNSEELRVSLEEGISLYLAEPGQDPPVVRLDGLHAEPSVAEASAELVLA